MFVRPAPDQTTSDGGDDDAASVGTYKKRTIELTKDDVDNAAVVTLESNGGVLYFGEELVHWRNAIPEGMEQTQVVFAWTVPEAGKCFAY